jgi:uncharacterized protein YyaL (SSP411 family)
MVGKELASRSNQRRDTKMNSGRTLALTTTIALLSLGTASTQAADRNQAYMEACRAEIEQYYGESRTLAVVSKRRIAEGTRVTLAARSDKDNAEFINCWIPNEERNTDFSQGANTVATTVTPVPVVR